MGFSKILVANRGEIACRILRTARELGYRTVAVYSDADARGLHVALADQAVRIGPAAVQESYLNIEALLRAAALSKADAVHPGYGFLSENAAFAEACAGAGLIFIGPTPHAMRAMGDKAAAKRLMEENGVPCIPGYHGAEQSDQRFRAEAERIGYPVMVKSAAGGGGIGMRLVSAPEELPAALAAARAQSAGAFGSAALLLERAIADARHVEIQIFGDESGAVIHLGERECSIQRRHQKLIEESPSPAVAPGLRERMGAAAVQAGRSVGYRGAGTVEFLLDPAGNFYFLEMNTRLQVEHAVTEAVTGLDLVEWQLRVAAGERLPLAQHEVRFQGHAIEARLYAEDPYDGYLPQSGTIAAWRPPAGAGVRVDEGIRTGLDITSFYDPLLAKVIAHGSDRREARRRLAAALEDLVVLGVHTNRALLQAIVDHPNFIAGAATTAFIGRDFAPASKAMQRPVPDGRMLALAAVLLFEHVALRQSLPAAGWRSTGSAAWPLTLAVAGEQHAVTISSPSPDRYAVALQERIVELEVAGRAADEVRFTVDGLQQRAHFALADGTLHMEFGGVTASFHEALHERRASPDTASQGRLIAPMAGRIVAVLAQPADPVTQGQRVIILEAMKMQHEIVAPRAGVVEGIAVRVGEQVAARQLLATLVSAQP